LSFDTLARGGSWGERTPRFRAGVVVRHRRPSSSKGSAGGGVYLHKSLGNQAREPRQGGPVGKKK